MVSNRNGDRFSYLSPVGSGSGMGVVYVLGSSTAWNSEEPKGYDDNSATSHTIEV